MSIWTMLLGQAKALEKVPTSSPPFLERLEPRLLLDANYPHPEPLSSPDAAYVPPASIDLDHERQQVPTSATEKGALLSYDTASLARRSPVADTKDADVALPSMRPDAFVAPKETVAEIAGSPPAGEGPYGATVSDTSEFMIGDIWVNLVLLESDGSIDRNTENWTATEIDNVKAEVQEGLAWWQDTLHSAPAISPLHDLTFHVDFTYADNPVATGYEPISRPAGGTVDEGLWIDDVLDRIGYNSAAPYYTDVRQWDHDQRIAHNVDWAYTIFVVDSSADQDGQFANGYFAYAYVGGPFLVMTYTNDGWGIDDMGQVLAHETGHIFYALDEYAGAGFYTDHSGYYNTQNLNALDGNPNPGSRVGSIMADVALQNAAYVNHTSSPTSLAMIGWKDSDSDGIFDVLDVPLTLNGAGPYNMGMGQYEFSGTSRVQTLANLNPRGPRHNITINTVDLLQYRVDSGPWMDGNRYGGYSQNVSQNVTAGGGSTIQLRAICARTGLRSPMIALGPAVTWDIDADGGYNALTDGLLAMRYLFGFRGDTLIADALAPNAQRATAADIEAYLAFAGSAGMLDIDGNGANDALTDGLLIMRYLFGFRGATLTDGAVAPGATRTTAEQIEAFLASYMPTLGPNPDTAPLTDSGAVTGQGGTDVALPSMRSDAFVVPAEPVEEIDGSPPAGEGPYGATVSDTSEFMIGDVWVNLVLLESDGSIDPNTENWTATEINNVKAEVQEGLAWWQDTLHSALAVSPLHDLTFHVDFTYADHPIATGYEPISRSAGGTADEGLWIDDVLDHVGYNSPAEYLTDVRQWDHNTRIAHNAEWAYTIFVIDSSADADGAFANGPFAYAYLGGPFLLMTYDLGSWGIENMGQMLAHETGHIFYALDEFSEAGFYTDHSGYYNTQNLNAYDGNPDPAGRVYSIMAETGLMTAAYALHTSSPSSLEMIGWKDSDSDGIFDVLDVPLTLDGSGPYNMSTGQYEFSGTSSVQTLTNLNPRGSRHNITINTVDLLQYRVDSGPWMDGNRYGGYSQNVGQNVAAGGGSTIQLRAICARTGLSSPIITLGPALSWDIDGNGSYNALTDGLLTMRYLFGFRGDTLIAEAVGPNARRSTAADIEAYLAFAASAGMLDIDGNGANDALTDGLLIMRYLFGFRGATLIDNAVAPDATRTTAEQIEAFITSFMLPLDGGVYASAEPAVLSTSLGTDVRSPKKAWIRSGSGRGVTAAWKSLRKKDLDRVGFEPT